MKKTILYFLILIFISSFVGLWFYSQNTKETLPPQVVSHTPEPFDKTAVTVSYGSSTLDDTREAVREAVQDALASFGDTAPEYGLFYYTVGYDYKDILAQINELLPNTELQGGSSMFGVFTPKGYERGKVGSFAIMLVSSDHIDFGVGGANVDEFATTQDAGRAAITEAVKRSGKPVTEMPDIVYMIGSFGNEEDLLSGIKGYFSEDVPVFGGSAFDDNATGKWSEIANSQSFVNGVSLAVFYTDLQVGYAYQSGYERTEYRGVVTRADDRTLYEIGGAPALDVYNEWTGGLVTDMTKGTTEDTFIEIQQTALNPIAKIRTDLQGKEHFITLHPYLWDLKSRSIGLGARIEVGDEVTLMHGTWETNLNHAKTTPALAMMSKNFERDKAYFGMMSYCVGKLITVPEEERDKIPSLIGNSIGNIPFIGANTGGEQGYLEGIGNEHGDLATDMVIFGPLEE